MSAAAATATVLGVLLLLPLPYYELLLLPPLLYTELLLLPLPHSKLLSTTAL